MTTRRQFLSLAAGDGWDDLPDSRRALNRAAADIFVVVTPILVSHFVDAIIGSVVGISKSPDAPPRKPRINPNDAWRGKRYGW